MANSGKYAEAAIAFNAVLKLRPGDTAALTRRGYVYMKMGKPEAFADFNTVLSQYPDNPRALLWRSYAYSNIKSYKLAIADLDRLILLGDPFFDSFAYTDRGSYKQSAGDVQGAISDYEKAISLAPGRAINYGNLGELLCETGRPTEGIAALSRAIQLEPDEEGNYVERAEHLTEMGNESAAIADYDKAYLLNAHDASRSAYILDKRAMCKYRLADHAGAIRDFNMVALIHGNYKDLFYYRGLAKIAIGDRNSGCDDLAEAANMKSKPAKAAIKKNCR